MKAEELENAVVRALLEIGSVKIAVSVEKFAFDKTNEEEFFHIRLVGNVFMDDLNAVVEATGDENIIIDGHPDGGLDIFCCIKSTSNNH